MNSIKSKKSYYLTVALMLSVSFAALDHVEAACNPQTGGLTPIVNNSTVACSGTTLNQNDPNGWGNGIETGNTINIQTGATVTGTAAGINVSDGTVNNGTTTSAGGIISATAAGGAAIKASGAGTITVGNFGDGVTSGLITAPDIGIFGDNAIVTNGAGAVIEATGGPTTGATAIQTNNLILDNAGTIRVNAGVGAIEIVHTGTMIRNSGTISAAGDARFAVGSDFGGLTVNNAAGGSIQTSVNGGIAIAAGRAATADANIINAGVISAPGPAGVAIKTSGMATVSNSGDGTTTGIITAGIAAIDANNVFVSGNSGRIEATSVRAFAVQSAGDANVNNGIGSILANANGSAAIGATGNATVRNGTGTIQANGAPDPSTSAHSFAIDGATVNVTGNDGVIEATGTGGIAILTDSGGATVTNGAGRITGNASAIESNAIVISGNAGTIEATALNGIAINATTDASVNNSGTIRADNGVAIQAGGKATVNNLSGGNITAGGTAISAAQLDITNAQGATISGGANGISGSGVVRNAGTISGNAASVSFTGPGPNTLALQTGSVLNGDAIGGMGAFNTLALEGHGTTLSANNFLGFELLDVRSGANWIWNTSATTGATISATAVNGTLIVEGVLVSPVTVNSGGVLAGHGTVKGVTVTTGGAITPGALTPLSTLNVTGGVTFDKGSIYRVNVDAAGHSDRLAIGANANLRGTVNVLLQNGFMLGTPYTILTANGGLGGTQFGGVSGQFAFLTPTLTYDANNVFLTFAATGPNGVTGFSSAAQTRNEKAVAGALDAAPLTNLLVSKLLTLATAAGARAAFDALSGEVFGSVHNVQTGQMQFARSAMLGRMRQASYEGAAGELNALSFGGPELAYASGDRAYAADFPAKAVPGQTAPVPRGLSHDLTFWAQGLGGWAHADSDGNAASLKSRFGGFLSGADGRLGEVWRAGLVAGYLRTDLNVADRSSSAGIDSVQFGGYAGGRLGVLNVRAGASYSYDSIDTSRGILFPGFTDKANVHFHGNVAQVFGEVGYGMELGSIAVEPIAGLAYVHVHDGSFAEAGGLAALSASTANENTGYSTLGLRAATAVPLANGMMLVPRGSLQWQYAFGEVTPVNALAFQSTGTSFTVAGIPIARNTALVEAGIDWRFSPQARLGAFYQGELAAHAESHAIKGAFTWDF